MPRRYSDGLDDLPDDQLRQLGVQYAVDGAEYRLNRVDLIRELRRRGARSPFVEKQIERETQPVDEYHVDDDAEERADLQEIVETYSDDDPDAPIRQWLVTLRSGNQMLLYGSDEAADDIAIDHDIRRLDDDDMMSLSTAVDEASTPIYQSMTGPSTGERRRRPRLPDRRRGKHETVEEPASIEQQRLKLPRYTPPPGPEGGSVSHFPRHRKR